MKNIYKLVFITTVLIFSWGILKCQDRNKAEEIENKLKSTIADTTRLNLNFELANLYLFTSTQKSKIPLHQALILALDLNDSRLPTIYNMLGICNFRLNKNDSALFYYSKALDIAQQMNDSNLIAKYYGNFGSTYNAMGNYKKALEYLYAAAEINKKKNKNSLTNNYLDIANTYYLLDDFEHSNQYALMGKNLAIELNKTRQIANADNTLGANYRNLNKHQKALKHFREALKMQEELGDKLGSVNALMNISTTYSNLGDTILALKYLETAIKISKSEGFENKLCDLFMNKGTLLVSMQKFPEANVEFLKAYEIYDKNNELEKLKLVSTKLGINFKRLNDYQSSSKYFSKSMTITDSLQKMNLTDDIAEMRVKFDTEKKELLNKQLTDKLEINKLKLLNEKSKSNTLKLIFGLSLILILLTSFFIFQRYRLNKKTELEKKIQDQKSMALKAVIEAEEKERIRIAKDLHDGIGQMLSSVRVNVASLVGDVNTEDEKILETAIQGIDESIMEVRAVSHNMMPVALIEYGLIRAVEVLIMRINQTKVFEISFKNNIESRLDQSLEISLYRIIQEVLNNTIKHSQADKIEIDLLLEGEKLFLTITDNGKGFNTTDLNKSKGIGWSNIISRLTLINGKMDVSSNPGAGTTIKIDLAIAS